MIFAFHYDNEHISYYLRPLNLYFIQKQKVKTVEVFLILSLVQSGLRPDIQKVVEFFSFSGLHPLVGYKLTQYNKWINDLRQSPRYCNLKLP
jgi:hypothetical protein